MTAFEHRTAPLFFTALDCAHDAPAQWPNDCARAAPIRGAGAVQFGHQRRAGTVLETRIGRSDDGPTFGRALAFDARSNNCGGDA